MTEKVEIELVGGPHDGTKIKVAKTTHSLNMPVDPVDVGRIGPYTGLPVLRRPDGRLYVQWPKGGR